MKLKYILLSFIAASFTLCSCSDFLDRQPLTDNTDEGFFTDPIQLQAYCNKKYELLPDFKDVNLFTDDQKATIRLGMNRKTYFCLSASELQPKAAITVTDIYVIVTIFCIIRSKI